VGGSLRCSTPFGVTYAFFSLLDSFLASLKRWPRARPRAPECITQRDRLLSRRGKLRKGEQGGRKNALRARIVRPSVRESEREAGRSSGR
jgi:hypothetical protein